VWANSGRHTESNKIVLRQYAFKAVRLKSGYLALMAQAIDGRFEAWTFIRSSRPNLINDRRVGRLLWSRR